MTPTPRLAWLALVAIALTAPGCQDNANVGGASPPPGAPAPTPPTPTAAASTEPSATPAGTEPSATPAAVTPRPLEAATTPAPAPASAEGSVKLEPVKYDDLARRIAANTSAKYTMVDVWASWCDPCKKNFPHVVEMNKKYAGKGLAVASLSFDDPADPKQVGDAKAFLAEKQATFTNFLLDEESGVGNEKLNISAIPAVFIFGPDGKEVKRFTLDDPKHQFTYEDVETAVVALLDGKPIPAGVGDPPSVKP